MKISLSPAALGVALSGLFSATLAAAPLPDILDYYPECFSEHTDPAVVSARLKTDDPMAGLSAVPGFRQLLQQLQEQAAASGAETLTIEKIEKSAPVKFQNRYNDGHTATIKISAKLLNYCADNKTLSDSQPPYNSMGQKIIKSTKLISIAAKQLVIQHEAPADLYKDPANYIVSVQQGVAGVLPGKSKTQVMALLGQPSVQIQLNNQQQMWGYGRKLWLTFADTLLWISTDPDLLSNYALNRIDLRDAYDNSSWSIEGKVPLKSQESTVLATLPGQFKKQAGYWVQQQSQLKLALQFESFKNNNSNTTEQLLTGFTLSGADKTAVTTATYSSEPIQNWLEQLKDSPDPGSDLKSLQSQVPVHQLHRGIDGSWLVAGNYLSLQYSHNRLAKLRLGQSMFGQHNTKELHQLIVAAGYPLTKAEFMARYPDAFDSGYEIQLYQEDKTLVAVFNSEAETAVIEELVLTLN
ncbi:MAG: hypothetical protein KJ556_08865 [Gammaproteobacteria bacterium]|nr:hypothetical protein [Gammaproteobacteria bacterium]MBU2059397.1 hypothetical protein [Gammaproteobacteria bacterium]MBU2175223.1 hypothetical protein [Gammaproteobacteria bacterium]MBU2247431.1 hypothetical protein [Gammaproteobacteria bacterium]MBU2346302.1 hypothetical protein [Gammaproteobacteria bacterium]